MRYQGKISSWKDEQGFGFVSTNGGGQKAFVHIKSFQNHSSRPLIGGLITYELAKDEKNRTYAKNIRFVGDPLHSKENLKGSLIPACFAISFFLALLILLLIERIPIILIEGYLFVSAITFIAYAIDKSAAKNNKWRTQESTLHLFSIAGGWPGAMLAQKSLRHKSKKEEFQNVFWCTVVINCSALGWLLLSDNGQVLMNSIS
jgi:uncharacterized membrane protein YsdA (DUF1294 family)/cold shock CspA family protein